MDERDRAKIAKRASERGEALGRLGCVGGQYAIARDWSCSFLAIEVPSMYNGDRDLFRAPPFSSEALRIVKILEAEQNRPPKIK
jgi:hypothetical protein